VRRTNDALTVPKLADLTGMDPHGVWGLQVHDETTNDVGLIRGFGLALIFA
jgi:subtilisin-like proprotein convertase family protein